MFTRSWPSLWVISLAAPPQERSERVERAPESRPVTLSGGAPHGLVQALNSAAEVAGGAERAAARHAGHALQRRCRAHSISDEHGRLHQLWRPLQMPDVGGLDES